MRELVIDPRDRHVTHILLDAGHLWGERTVAVPISAVESVADGVRLKITKAEVRDLSLTRGAPPGAESQPAQDSRVRGWAGR